MNRKQKPAWLKVRLAGGREYRDVRQLIQDDGLHTVCQSARCPNIGDCWSRRTATFMILGEVCTRNCRFCAVEKGRPEGLNPEEPYRVAKAVKQLKLRHAVITSVTRDDLSDSGAGHFVNTLKAIRAIANSCSVELLIPDFQGNEQALRVVFEEKPDILNHNLEVVPSLYPKARPQADFRQSLNILTQAKSAGLMSKTGIMIGLGETWEEIIDLFEKLVSVKLDVLTIGQYLQPTSNNLSVVKYYTPDEFNQLKKIGEAMGIPHVESGPLVRSSYHADEQYQKMATFQ